MSEVTVVIPTLSRPSLVVLLNRLDQATGPRADEVIVVDDRAAGPPLDVGDHDVHVQRSRGRGPAAARNVGWRHASTEWVAFLDDDVLPDLDWWQALRADLIRVDSDVVGVQGRVHVPLPQHRRPTDWERGTAGLATARWITADMAYRREVLAAVGGFDERLHRAFREDADLALRVLDRGLRLVRGQRRSAHPVRAAGRWASVGQQAGNADDMLMRRLHGPDWRARAGAPRGRRRRHAAVTVALMAALSCVVARRPRPAAVATVAAGIGIGELIAARLRPGPRTRDEIATIVLTSMAIPVVATWHTLTGALRHRGAQPWKGPPDLVLFDRDGTLVVDVPYNGDPNRVELMPHARETCDRLRAAGVRLGVVSNQSGVARGLLTSDNVAAVNARIAELLGEFGTWEVCPHGPEQGCGCRKPAPGMIHRACERLDVRPERCVVIGDIGADVEAALSAGAIALLVPTAQTRAEEVAAAPRTVRDLREAADVLLGAAW